ncbi:predicted protein [Histoplasma capsulatum G186AR]|uniref:Uncharacterized protein n=1 Tax=Ajellomyces capsulatus (strain G186AR / H82 / ATCC MYA-2454 / RMSCC 2432) TaxID=447093 RepID=C0NZJ0_AJECG|nr:uncharacterized protein HCBG_08570 [Histoplasma capsulatum G186AR]EEH03238.1 predicted protein [Histoplasma capsulatum G186AR]
MGVKGRGRRGAKVDCLSGDLSWVRWNDDDGAAAAAAAAEGRWLDGIESSQAQQRERSGLLYNSIPSASSEFFSSFKHSTAQHTFVQVGLLRPSSREEKRIREQRTKKITKLNKKEELCLGSLGHPEERAGRPGTAAAAMYDLTGHSGTHSRRRGAEGDSRRAKLERLQTGAGDVVVETGMIDVARLQKSYLTRAALGGGSCN